MFLFVCTQRAKTQTETQESIYPSAIRTCRICGKVLYSLLHASGQASLVRGTSIVPSIVIITGHHAIAHADLGVFARLCRWSDAFHVDPHVDYLCRHWRVVSARALGTLLEAFAVLSEAVVHGQMLKSSMFVYGITRW
jgi:hypothetical protein